MSEKDKEEFASLLKYYIKLNGLTQKEFCDKVGVGESTVSMWCSGSREPKSIEQVKEIARVLNVSVSDLIGDKNSEYYLDEGSRELADFVHKNPEYKVLFDFRRVLCFDKKRSTYQVRYMLPFLYDKTIHDEF